MYYSNINDDEVKMFHGVTAPNFTIKLTDILHKTGGSFDNKLFKIEEIVSGKVFKIYPMFNTNKIISSNPNDKILDNRLIIAEKTSKETRISFISDDDEEVEDYVAYGTYKSIGDNLSTAEFNSIVQLLRNNHILTDNLHIKNGTLDGEYGEYIFNIDSTTIVDNGILITNETLTNLGTVTLTNPSFNNATYTLYLTVYSYDDVNIMTDETTTDPTITTLEIELIKDTAVNIPFNTLTSSCIVSFEATIQIKQDKPCISGQIIDDVVLSVNPTIFQIGDTSTLTATVNDKEGLPMANKTVSFYTGSSLINTSNTNTEGIATLSYASTGLGKSDFTAKCLNYQSNSVSVTDAYFYDQAITGHKNNNWTVGEAITVETGETGTTLSITSATVASGYQIPTTSLSGDFEAIVYTESGDNGNSERASFGITDGTTRRFFRKGGNYWLKLVRENGTTTGYYSSNKEDWTSASMSGTEITANTVYLILGTYNNTTTTRTIFYNNLIVYSI